MGEFEPITTQEQLDEIISSRLKRDREATAKKYADYDDIKGKNDEYVKRIAELEKANGDLTKKYEGYDSQILDLQNKCKEYEADRRKTDIALEYGLPYAFASRLRGDTDEDIRKDAQDIMAVMKDSGRKSTKAAPSQSDDAGKGKPDGAKAAFAQLLTDLNVGGN